MKNNLEHIKQFKQKCKEYEDFFNDIKLITKDYCLLHKKKNPLEFYSSYDDHIGLSIDEFNITIYYKEEIYSCGSCETEHFELTIPLDFYDNIDNEKQKIINKEEKLKELNDRLSYLNYERNKLNNEYYSISDDLRKLSTLATKYKFEFNNEELKEQEKSFQDKIKEIDLRIKETKTQITNLK